MQKVRIEVINKAADHLDTVKALWRENSQTLGFFPEGAFEDYAAKRTILIAVDENEHCIGYLLYRISKEQASITHLCVDEDYREKGIARLLVNKLVEITSNVRGISLKCRKDFAVDSLWPRLLFHLEGYRKGRGKKSKQLVYWWRPQRQEETLFSKTAARLHESKISAVIDLNVLFDLQEEPSEKTIPSKSLQADWLADTLELFVTEEIFNELNRNQDPSKIKKSRQFANDFYCLPCDINRIDNIIKSIRPFFSDNMSEQDWSDLRQVARAIAGEASFFVTRDDALLEIADKIEEKHQLVILHPTDLIIRLDELQRANEYQPVRFVQTQCTIKLIRQGEEKLAANFCNNSLSEKQSELLIHLRYYLSSPKKYKCLVIIDKPQNPLALLVIDISSNNSNEMQICLLRVGRSELASTLARQMVRQCLLLTQGEEAKITKVIDRFLDDEVQAALHYFGFFETKDSWVKISLPVAESGAKIADRIVALSDYISVEKEALAEWVNKCLRDPKILAIPEHAIEQEHLLWPAKITDARIPTYIVPIEPRWAQELFDEKLASNSLFGRDQEIAINTEAVYYRSARGKIIAPGRIFWYVSGDKDVKGAMSIRACSRLEQVEIGLPKELYRKYKRLGIYEWKHIFKTAHSNIGQNIMALKFSDTELFPKPMSWKRLQDILKSNGISTQIQQPLSISSEIFLKIYSEAAELT
jgi:predicted nucleic acid-binding protein/GNAT superfamily N-acetyltransferase